jgi:hypothetical protein
MRLRSLDEPLFPELPADQFAEQRTHGENVTRVWALHEPDLQEAREETMRAAFREAERGTNLGSADALPHGDETQYQNRFLKSAHPTFRNRDVPI